MNNWKKEKVLGVQPSMDEIFVAQGKRRRSVALGKNEQKKTVRTKMFFQRINLISDGIEITFRNLIT